MPKGHQYTEGYFLSKGYTKNPDGSFSPPTLKKGFIGQKNGFKEEIKDVYNQPIKAFKDPNHVIRNTVINDTVQISPPTASVLTIDGIVAGLNGAKGLMRSHWTNVKKQKTLYQQIIQQHLSENKVRKHVGEVTVEYIGYKSLLMDWDNFCASFKHIGDSLVKMGIIKNDNPKIITQFLPSQIKCSRQDQKVIVIIKDR